LETMNFSKLAAI